MVEWWLSGHFFLILSYGMAIVGIAHMLRHRRSPGSTIAWLLAFITLPYLGTALYLMFGGRKLKRRQRDVNRHFHERRAAGDNQVSEFERTLRSYGAPPATSGNDVVLCRDGVEGYRQLTEMIEEARHYIYLMTFIFGRDKIAKDILKRLTDRASDGLDVRILVDGLGSLRTPSRFFEDFEQAGGRLAVFEPVIHIPFRTRTNLRNHRKITIVDGYRSFAGGMNITDEDLYRKQASECWQDLSLAIAGPAAGHLESIFREDWAHATGDSWENGPPEPARKQTDADAGDEGDGSSADECVQILVSGPDVPNDPMYAASLTAIFRARQRVWIITPYFVPSDPLVEALVFACHRHVDVRILIPATSNHPISDLAGASLLRDVQSAGGTVFRYPSMVHAKAMIVDDQYAAVGSANFDMRSLFLNYEVMQVCYSQLMMKQVSDWFLRLSQSSTTDLPQPSFLREVGEGAVRALAPMF